MTNKILNTRCTMITAYWVSIQEQHGCLQDTAKQFLMSHGGCPDLSCDEQNVKMMVKGPGLKLLMKRALYKQKIHCL